MLTFFRIIKFAIQGFYRNFWLSLATITMMVMALISVTTLLAMSYVKESAIQNIENKVNILASLKYKLERDQVEILAKEIDDLPEVARVSIVTPEQNRDQFAQANADTELAKVLSVFGQDENPFSYTLVIEAYNINQYQTILNFISQEKYQPLIQSSVLKDYNSFIQRINGVSHTINRFSLYITILFMLVAIIIIFNTVRMSVYTRRDEVMVMKLVGASDMFVRLPFFIEGALYALLAVALLASVFFFVLSMFEPRLVSYFGGGEGFSMVAYFRDNFWLFFGSEFLALVGINIFATASALRKYLKV